MLETDHPAAFGQERIWFLQQLDPADRSYQFQATLSFEGPLDPLALQRALNRIVARHEIFRTTFPAKDGMPVQRIEPAAPASFAIVDLERGAEPGAALRTAIDTAFAAPFDVARLPLVRWTLLRVSPERHVLVHVEHHLVHDGWSFNIFLGELAQTYRALRAGSEPMLEPAPTFVDFARRQRLLAETPQAAEALAYWKRTLAGAPALLPLPVDKPRPPVLSHAGDCVVAELPPALLRALERVARERSATPFMTMLAAFAVLLSRSSLETDICIGSGIAGRDAPHDERLVGMLVNTVVLRVDVSGDPPFVDLLERVKTVAFEAYAHQQTPLERVVEAVSPMRDPSINPLFSVLFSFHDSPRPELDFGDVRVTLDETESNASAKLDLNIVCIPRGDRMTVKWEYRSDLFERETMVRMLAHFERLLSAVAEEPERRISRFAFANENERRALRAHAENPKPYRYDASIDALFEAHVKATPDAPALIDGDSVASYAELDRRANRLARHLRTLGVRAETCVGVLLERSSDAIVTMLAVLKAGGAYVPLDVRYPRERIAWILEDAAVALSVTSGRLRERLPPLAKALVLEDCAAELARESSAALDVQHSADSLAYIMYTSGSTGVPKGVCIPHRGVVRLVTGDGDTQIRRGDVVLAYASYAFDGSTYEIWGALSNGAVLAFPPRGILSPAELGTALARRNVSVLFLTTPLFHQMVESRSSALASLRLLVTGGDALSPVYASRFVAHAPHCRLVNGYGPTENTTFTTTYVVPPGGITRASTPIGSPVNNTSVYVLDRHGVPTAPGEPGEIWTGGDGLARGYLGRPDLTDERFVADRFSERAGARLYRTGDLGRWCAGGVLEFLGRSDGQVKIRGFRVELGEIEAALLRHPAVREAAVSTESSPEGERSLAGFVVPVPRCELDDGELRRFLRASLPDYAVPSRIDVVAALPASVGGKIDRAALVRAGRAPQARRDATLHGPVERRLADIWREVLKVGFVSRDDDFFDLGGHSLMAMRVLARLNEAFDVELSLRELFERRTLAALAETIAAAPTVAPPAEFDVASLSDEEIDALLAGSLADAATEL